MGEPFEERKDTPDNNYVQHRHLVEQALQERQERKKAARPPLNDTPPWRSRPSVASAAGGDRSNRRRRQRRLMRLRRKLAAHRGVGFRVVRLDEDLEKAWKAWRRLEGLQ